MTHNDPHPLAGQAVKLNATAVDPVQKLVLPGAVYQLEDWWDRVAGQSWMVANGNPAAMHYAVRSAFNAGIPTDDEVVYGKIGGLGHLVHVSELENGGTR
jgi:hypothetical protein